MADQYTFQQAQAALRNAMDPPPKPKVLGPDSRGIVRLAPGEKPAPPPVERPSGLDAALVHGHTMANKLKHGK
jgi:hypothetical protein